MLVRIFNGSLSFTLYFFNTIFWFVPILIGSIIKLLPLTYLRTITSKFIDACASNWISVNTLNQLMFSRTKFELKYDGEFDKNAWYLVIANHQSWVDILVLQRIFNRKIPFLKFFLKRSLLYVPILGLAWWGLDFPFMRRYSKEYLRKHPEKKGKDLETTRAACEKFEHTPVSIMNFVEGTRFSSKKLDGKHTKALGLKHILAPKSAGIAYVLTAMGERLSTLVDVTIYYPNGIPSFWDFACGKVNKIVIHVQSFSMTQVMSVANFNQEYFSNSEAKAAFQDWLNNHWKHKDEYIEQLKTERT